MFSLKIALALGCVLLDQRLETGIFAQRVPLWIEFENRDRDAVWNFNQMLPVISLAKRSLFARTVRITRAAMFSMGAVTF